MELLKQLVIFVLLGMGSTVALSAADGGGATRLQRYALAQQGYLELLVPSNWSAQVSQPKDQKPPIISFDDRTGKPFIVTVAPIWKGAEPNLPPNKDALRKRVENDANGIRLMAVEKDIKLVELKGTSGGGYYFLATDPAPGQGYRFMTKGELLVGDLTVLFAILTNDGQESIVRQALAMLQSARHARSKATIRENPASQPKR